MNASRNDQAAVHQLVLLRRVRDRIDGEFDRLFKRSMAQFRRRNLSIPDISLAVGFSSLGTLRTLLRELGGLSPSRCSAGGTEGDHDLSTFIIENELRPVRNREVPPGVQMASEKSLSLS